MSDKSKVFRLYSEGADTYQDWNAIVGAFPYNSTNRQNIIDPDGDKATNEITSIPSPFARIDIAKNAFAEVNKLGLDGKTYFHKTVSDIMDVGEIFFNYEKFKNKVEIIAWNPKAAIEELLESGEYTPGHLHIAEAFKTYLASDKGTYNFDDSQNFYILNHKNGRHSLDVIGATSPATMFFSSANDLSAFSKDFSFNKTDGGFDYPFDTEYNPLYNRDPEYIKMWFVMRASIPGFSTKMPEIDKYLNSTMAKLKNGELRKQLKDISANDAANFNEIQFSSDGMALFVDILGVNLVSKKIGKVESEFKIKPTREVVSCPLVLPVEKGSVYKDFAYSESTWGTEAYAPFFDERPLDKRTLPFDDRQQPYLTISDFLEDNIICVPHKLNSDYFVNAMTFVAEQNSEEITYLLPLKPKFFEYFDVADLFSNQENGLSIKIDSLAGGKAINVTLQIPVVGHGRIKTVTYTRRYSGNEADIDNNKGGVESFDFTGLIMPFVKVRNEELSFYTVANICTSTRNYNFTFYKNDSVIPSDNIIKESRHVNSAQNYKAEVYSLERVNFDFIQVSNSDGYKGVLIPKFKEHYGNSAFNVSVDLGTSNTHIEIQKANTRNSSAFEMNENSPVLCTIFIPSTPIIDGYRTVVGLDDEEQIIIRDFLPKSIGKDSLYSYPTRTVISCANTFRPGQENRPFSLYNVSLTYDKIEKLDYNKNITNIKWGEDDNLLAYYIQNTLLMIRNNILASDGNLSETNITWFFPTSMPKKRKNKLRDIWNKAYQMYFGEGETHCISESSAPINHLFNTQDSSENALSIDIGGGTTDIAFAKDKKVLAVSSFRFASNTLFENQLAPGNFNNGIVDYFKQVLLDTIESNGLLEEVQSLFEEESHEEPANMASFLFSLKDNEYLESISSDEIDFNKILNNDEKFKIVFILFYAAILFHVSKIIKQKDFELPRHISFSGNGSKILGVITTNKDDLADLSKKIIEKVSGKKFEHDLTIVGIGDRYNPKAATCKGGLGSKNTAMNSDPIVVMRADGKAEIDESITYGMLRDDNEHLASVIETVNEFMDVVFKQIPHKYYDDTFGVDRESFKKASEVATKDIQVFLKKGLSLLIEENSVEDIVEETLFFYPIKGVMNAISSAIKDIN